MLMRALYIFSGGGGLVAKLCPTVCDSMDYGPPGFSVHGISQARILEQVAIFFSRGSSQPRDRACISCIAAGFFFVEPCENPSKSFSMKVKIKVVQSCLTLYDPKEFSRLEYWSGQPFPSPGDLPNLGIEPWSPALQVDSLPDEPPGKSKNQSGRNQGLEVVGIEGKKKDYV